MAETTRRKKLEKTSVDPPIPTQKCYCYRCGLSFGKRQGNFSVSHSPMYRGIGYLPVCNDCVDDMHEQYVKTLGDEREAMRRMCMKFDLYWDDDIYNMVARANGVRSRVRNYIGKTNIIRYLDKNFDDTLKNEDENGTRWVTPGSGTEDDCTGAKFAASQEAEEVYVDPEIIEFWGEDFTPMFYLKLDKRYKSWTKNLGDLDNGAIALYKQICILEEIINRDAALGKPVDKSMNMLNTLLGSANLKPAQKKTDSDVANDNTPFGVWIRRWENQRPIPDPDPELKDVDGIVRYIHVFFLGHLAKMLGKKNIYSRMYEEEMAKLRVERPEFTGDDDEEVFEDMFGLQEEDGDVF